MHVQISIHTKNKLKHRQKGDPEGMIPAIRAT